jgi:hypothetical protein
LRMIRQLAQMLLHIMGLIKAQEYRPALEAIDRASKELLGLDIDVASRLSPGELMALLTVGQEHKTGRDKCAFLVALLQQAGIVHAAQNQPDESHAAYVKALHILLELSLRGDRTRLPDYTPAVEDLVAGLKTQRLSVETGAGLLLYYEQTGKYARAEDVLFKMMEVEPANTDIVGMGIAFYERLQKQSDDTLVAGNLPRDEVNAGLTELRTRQRGRTA